MTLPNEEVRELLASRFVLGYRNIESQVHVGISHGYACDQTAVATTNGAGGRNVQFLVLSPDGVVVHALPGFWHPADLVPELKLALELHDLWRDETRQPLDKLAMFHALHRSFVRRLPEATLARSSWQDFDQWAETARAQRESRDTLLVAGDGSLQKGEHGRLLLKPVVQVVHERLQRRAFLPLAQFDLEGFVDYGRAFYDNNAGFDRGRDFPAAAVSNQRRAQDDAAREAAERQLAAAALAAWQPPKGKGKRR